MRLSSLANKQPSLFSLVINEASQPPSLSTGNLDFSTLVELRRLHQTRYAAEGVRTRDAVGSNRPEESVRCRLIRELNTLLRQEGNRATGTGQDRKLRWHAPNQEGPVSTPAENTPTPASTGNSANAAVAAQSRTKKVPFWLPRMPLPSVDGCLGTRVPTEQVHSRRSSTLQHYHNRPSFFPLPYHRRTICVGFS